MQIRVLTFDAAPLDVDPPGSGGPRSNQTTAIYALPVAAVEERRLSCRHRARAHLHTHTHSHTRTRTTEELFFFRIVPRGGGGSTKPHQNTKMKPITFEFVCASSQFNLQNDTFRFASHQQRMFSRVQTIYLIIILVICVTGKS